MQKKVLSEQALYFGDVAMPKGWDIDRDKLQSDILQSQINNKEFPFSRTVDMLNTYMREHINLNYGFTLISKKIWGDIYKPQETINSIYKFLGIPKYKHRFKNFKQLEVNGLQYYDNIFGVGMHTIKTKSLTKTKRDITKVLPQEIIQRYGKIKFI